MQPQVAPLDLLAESQVLHSLVVVDLVQDCERKEELGVDVVEDVKVLVFWLNGWVDVGWCVGWRRSEVGEWDVWLRHGGNEAWI